MKRCNWILLLFVSFSFLLSGCIETNIIEEISLVHGVAYDTTDSEQKEITVAFPNFIEQGEESGLFSQSLSASEMTTNGAINLIDVKTQKPLKFGQARVFIFSDSIAEKGIEHLADSLYRNPDVPTRVQLAVSEGEAKEIFKVAGEQNDRIGVFVPDLIEHVQGVTLPKSNLHIFLYSMYNDGRDAFLPLIKSDEELKIIGTALFDYDKYVDKINLKESFVLRLLTNRGRSGSQQYTLTHEGEKLFVVVENITSMYRVEMIENRDVPTFEFFVKIRGEVTDISARVNLDDPEFTDRLEEEMQGQIGAIASDLVKRFKELEIDPLGLGEQYRSRTRNWNPEEWQELYKEIEVMFHINIEIIHSGAIE
ncbi:hypothetical protein BTR23_00990 [Alkalihalophilus pseudofirmus]|nr:hypothetical protein BTR23_00990 [Alkalihalophilus pseudofirmus]